ncbi:histidine phosphatase family protein [Tateyamaria omphalii]|uniref:histidine phosphatase family protein n=1 Tax=Tateyamaria omphalii TaxID=299262 RepID=UPI001C99FFA6|nr:histidine phosphatase family protein [Tateyamaria omphalii]MBY5935325.1 histidine phosphatase family protein [Tateyamaria omphalii]
MIRLALLRHGHTAWNREGRLQGRSDIPLDDDARTELGALSLPKGWHAADLVSSPLTRAVQTATLVAGHAPRIEPSLIEMNWGTFEGQHGAELAKDPASGFRHIEDWGWDYCPPGGEPPSALRDRLIPWARDLERDTVAICHIGTMRVLLALATGWQFEGPAPFRIKRNRLFILHIDGDTLTLAPDVERLERR